VPVLDLLETAVVDDLRPLDERFRKLLDPFDLGGAKTPREPSRATDRATGPPTPEVLDFEPGDLCVQRNHHGQDKSKTQASPPAETGSRKHAGNMHENVLEVLLTLDRPLVVFDTETTGTNPRLDRIIEIACVKLNSDGTREEWVRRFNPGTRIPPASSAIHRIHDRDVATMPRFRDCAVELAAFLEGCDLAGYNMTGFDLPVLRNEFHRAGIVFDVTSRRLLDGQRIFFSREPRNLSAAARFYCETDHDGAHGALADARMTLKVIAGQLDRYADLPRSVAALHELFCAGIDQDMDPEGRIRLVNGEPTINFGRHRGRSLRALSREEPGVLRWIIKGDFSRFVKEIVGKFLPKEDAEKGKAETPPPAKPDAQPTMGSLFPLE
jgi:DNA polymerase III subunit epsilon